jgi:hypothetical protein
LSALDSLDHSSLVGRSAFAVHSTDPEGSGSTAEAGTAETSLDTALALPDESTALTT